MTFNASEFTEIQQEWDLETLYEDLASAKGKRLTPMEKVHLRGLLAGHSPTDIAEKLHKIPKGVESDLCVTIYRYVKALTGFEGGKLESWRQVSELLENAGYKGSKQIKLHDILPEQSYVVIVNFNVDSVRQELIFQINLHIPTQPTKINTEKAQKSASQDD